MPIRNQAFLRDLVNAALAAVAPDGAVRRHLHLHGGMLHAGEFSLDLDACDRVLVVGAGKGAAPMAVALESLLGDRLGGGLVIVKHGHTVPLKTIRLIEAGHPVPDRAGMEGAERILKMVGDAGERDCVICVITGGASALTPALSDPLSLDDLQMVTGLLLGCGATIHEINTVRKHLSVFSGGRLAQAIFPARALSLIVSDVVGNDLDVIASGPTVPDLSTFADCARVLEIYGLWEQVPTAVAERIRDGQAGKVPETPKPGDRIFSGMRTILVATLSQALEAAAAEARRKGYHARVLCDDMTGEARDCAARFVAYAKEVANGLKPGDTPVCLLAGGETTVTLKGEGLGGRNQEMALAATLALAGDERISMVFAGTDGTDGPTDAAGGYVDGYGAARAGELGLDLAASLTRNDSYHALEALGTLLKTGPTRTNVMDMAIALIEP